MPMFMMPCSSFSYSKTRGVTQTYRRRVVKLRFFSLCFEYQDLFVGNRIVYPSESYFSRKVMSEVSVSRRRRSPSARSALPLTCTPSFSRSHYRSSRKARQMFWQKEFFRGKFWRRGGSPLLAPEGGSGFAEARLTLPWWLDFICVCKRGIWMTW
jgi:hypothetical protein